MKIKSKLLMLLWTIILAFAMSSCSLGTYDSFSGSNLITVGGSSSLSREAASQLGRREVSSENINVEDIDFNTVVVSNLSTPLNISDQSYLEDAIQKGAMLLLENTTPSVMDKVVGIGIDSPSVAVMTSSDGLVLEVFAQGSHGGDQNHTFSDTVSVQTGEGDAVPSDLVEPESLTPSRSATSGNDFSPLDQLVKEAKKRENGNKNRSLLEWESKRSPSWLKTRLSLSTVTYKPGGQGLATIDGVFEIEMASIHDEQKKIIILRSTNSAVSIRQLWRDEAKYKGFFTAVGYISMSPIGNTPQRWIKDKMEPFTDNSENHYFSTTGWGFDINVGGAASAEPELKGTISYNYNSEKQDRISIKDFRTVNMGGGHVSQWRFENSLWGNGWRNLWNGKTIRNLPVLSKGTLTMKAEIIYVAPITDKESYDFKLSVDHKTVRTYEANPWPFLKKGHNTYNYWNNANISINLGKIRYPIKDRDLEDNMNAYIRNVYSQKYVDVRQESRSSGASLIQWPYNGKANQCFNFVGLPEKGTYYIISSHSKMVLSEGPNHFVKQIASGSSDSQEWKIEPVSMASDNIKYRIKNVKSERYLYPMSNSVQNSAPLKTTLDQTERTVAWVIEG